MEKSAINFLGSEGWDRVPIDFFDEAPNPSEKTHAVATTQLSAPKPQQPSALSKRPKYLDPMYKCPVVGCIIDYARRNGLKHHIMVMHPDRADLLKQFKPRVTKKDKAFPCPIETCQSGYTRKNDLFRHTKRLHPDTVDSEPKPDGSGRKGLGQ